MKAANQAWYWLAAGVLALGLNGYYQDGGFQGLHRLAGHATAMVAVARAQARQFATVAEAAWDGNARCPRPARVEVAVDEQVIPPRAQARLAQLQEELAGLETARVRQLTRLQETIAQREIRRAQVQLENNRILVLTDQARVRVELPPIPRVQIHVPRPAVEIVPN